MRPLLHRTIPFIAFAAVVTASSAGAQERDDSTSTMGGVASLVGLGGKFVVLSGGDDETSRPNDWNCAGGCRAFGARSLSIAPYGAMVSASRASAKSSLAAAERSARSLADRADLSDYGWSRRVNTDGSPVGPATDVPVFSDADADAAPSSELPTPRVSAPQPDGVGPAPAWTALGSGPSELNAPHSDMPGWTNDADGAAGASGNSENQAVTPGPVVNRFAEPVAQVAPLVTTVPEPSTVVLLAVGLSSLLVMRRRSSRTR